jgi:hypothetical protein
MTRMGLSAGLSRALAWYACCVADLPRCGSPGNAVSNTEADEVAGRAHWEARYSFGATGRKVLNRVDARFEFRNGLIVRHIDAFDFARWARQALGLPGLLLGWSGLMRGQVRAKAARGLCEFKASLGGAARARPAAPQAA